MKLVRKIHNFRNGKQLTDFIIVHTLTGTHGVIQKLAEDSLVYLHMQTSAPEWQIRIIKICSAQIGSLQVGIF